MSDLLSLNDLHKIRDKGDEAYRYNNRDMRCPYSAPGLAREAWLRGWNEAKERLIELDRQANASLSELIDELQVDDALKNVLQRLAKAVS